MPWAINQAVSLTPRLTSHEPNERIPFPCRSGQFHRHLVGSHRWQAFTSSALFTLLLHRIHRPYSWVATFFTLSRVFHPTSAWSGGKSRLEQLVEKQQRTMNSLEASLDLICLSIWCWDVNRRNILVVWWWWAYVGRGWWLYVVSAFSCCLRINEILTGSYLILNQVSVYTRHSFDVTAPIR